MIQTRWMISMLGMYACALMFMYRAGISVALVYMTKQQQPQQHPLQNVSVDPSSSSSSSSSFATYFDWNQSEQGTILSASFYLYWCLPSLIGSLTDHHGGKWFAFAAILGPCLLSLLSPWAIERYGRMAFIWIQTLVGGFHGFIYPALFSLYSKWFTVDQERTKANSLMQVGNAFGCFLMYLLAGYLCTWTKLFGWHLVFYVIAWFHLPWLILWFWFTTNQPLESKQHVQPNEFKICSQSQKNAPTTPWLRILCSKVVWSSVICKMCCAFGFFLLLNKMPSYFATVFQLDIRQNGQISAMVIAAYGCTSFFSPFIAQYLQRAYRLKPILVKKISQNIAMIGPAICLFGIPVFQTNQSTTVFILMIMAMFMHGFFTSGEWTIVSDYARNFSGSIVGFVHSLAFLMGVLAPMLVGYIFQWSLLEQQTLAAKWNIVFYITAVAYLVGGVVFTVFGSDQQQDWDKI